MFNISYKTFLNFVQVENVAWALALESITYLEVSSKLKFKLKIFIDANTNKRIVEKEKLKFKDASFREFLFFEEENLKNFIFNLKRLYFDLSKKYLELKKN